MRTTIIATRLQHLVLIAVLSVVGGCALEVVRPPVSLLGAEAITDKPPESLLLDVGIAIFTPLHEPVVEQRVGNLQNLRTAESHYASWLLAQTLERSGQWGAVRLNPFAAQSGDLMLTGAILQSDGETLRLQLHAVDATGYVWLDKTYVQIVTAANYGTELDKIPAFPFQPMINRIANELLLFRQQITAARIADVRKIAALRFAANLAPDLYGSYLTSTKTGLYEMARLPASNDGIFAEMQNIRDRNRLFLDAIGLQYTVYANQVNEPYRNFLKRSRQITELLNGRFIDERAASGFMSMPSLSGDFENAYGKAATRIKEENKRSNSLNSGIRRARMYAAALAEANSVFEMDVQPQTVRFAAHTVQLSGTLEQQFTEWQQILREIQQLETAE